MKAFAVAEARALEATSNSPAARWLLKGRAHEDVRVGDTLKLGDVEVRIELIRTYGKDVEVLSRMMTGDLVVQLPDGEDYF